MTDFSDPAGRGNSVTSITESDVLVVGSGAAGMTVALASRLGRVTLLNKIDRLTGGSTHWAQGGIAAAIGADDNPGLHAADTVAVGHDLVEPTLAKLLASEGKDAIENLLSKGFPADLGSDGRPLLSREAAHSCRRIVHAGGDSTGRHLAAFLAAHVERHPRITVAGDAIAVEIVCQNGRVVGIMAHDARVGWVFHRAPRVVLATGGTGQVFGRTTNPTECTGDGLALAAAAGCQLVDIEFVQFHPTALAADNGTRQRALLTEALRGEGAVLVDDEGRRFMEEVHPDCEMAPRDVVAKAIWQVISRGSRVFLDLRPVMRDDGASRFPTVVEICRKAGYDPFLAPVPVEPVAHYHMGGVATDANGRTGIPGLWACGEVACTGVHGANRLASNSLLEALVFGRRVAADLAAADAAVGPVTGIPVPPRIPDLAAPTLTRLRDELASEMYRGAGLVRDEQGMVAALQAVERIEAALIGARQGSTASEPHRIRTAVELSNMVAVSRAILIAALQRRESRGGHFRSDFRDTGTAAVRNFLTLREIDAMASRWRAPAGTARAGAGE